jgi:hypothetical protein
MPKSNKDELDEIMKKRFEKRKEDMYQEAKSEIKTKLSETCYTVSQHPEKSGRNYVVAKINFDLKTMKAVVEDYKVLDQKVIGMRYPMDQDQIKYYYDKSAKMGD